MSSIQYPEMFRYTKVALPEGAIHGISPSSIYKFFSEPNLYYSEKVLENPSSFQGNDNTTIGSICHHIYKEVALGKEVKREELNTQLDEYASLRPELGLDVDFIKSVYPAVAMSVVNEYLLKTPVGTKVYVEEQVQAEVANGVYIGGTYDRFEDYSGGTLCDFKNVGKKPDENEIPFHYLIQLLSYAYALRKCGKEVSRIRIIYGVRPTKTLPARTYVVSKEIDKDDEKLIEDTLNLIADSVVVCRDHPELVYLVFKDMSLKR